MQCLILFPACFVYAFKRYNCSDDWYNGRHSQAPTCIDSSGTSLFSALQILSPADILLCIHFAVDSIHYGWLACCLSHGIALLISGIYNSHDK